MRRYRVIAASLVALATALPAQAAPEGRAAALTIRLVSTTTDVRLQKDVAPKQTASKGDVIWQRSILRNAVAQFGKPKGAVVGSDTGTITILSLTALDTKGVAVLPGGTVRFSGRTTASTRPVILSVTGGTGRYAGTRGKLDVRSLDGTGARTSNVYHLALP
jgi:hypothetical protein